MNTLTRNRTLIGLFLFSFLFGITFSCQPPQKSSEEQSKSLPRSTPEEQGLSSAAISTLIDSINASGIGFHSLMIVRHGQVVAEGWWSPYQADYKHTLYSLSKSFTSTAVGFAVSEGLLTVEDQVLSFFPEYQPEMASENLEKLKVKHLLTMSTGHTGNTMDSLRKSGEDNWVKVFMQLEIPNEPGSVFLYNTAATYMLSAIVQKKTGKNLVEYLTPRLFEPLGIEGIDWEEDPFGINVGGYGLRVKTEDIAKFGQLYLDKGRWNGKQILSEEWIEEATTSKIASGPNNPAQNNSDSDWAQGYGYQFWRCKPDNLYRGDGAFGQYCIVMPDQDAVVAITSESFDMQASMRLIWKYLLPAFQETPLEPAGEDLEELNQKLATLTLSPPALNPNSSLAGEINGKTFLLDSNALGAKSFTLTFSEKASVLTLENQYGIHRLTCGINSWIEEDNRITSDQLLFPVGRSAMDIDTRLAASSGWSDDTRFVIYSQLSETAHADEVTFDFQGDQVTLSFLNSVAKARPNEPEERVNLTGRRAK